MLIDFFILYLKLELQRPDFSFGCHKSGGLRSNSSLIGMKRKLTLF